MIIGEYPCCGGDLWVHMMKNTPIFEKEICPHCGETVWHYHSRIRPISYTQEQFDKKYMVNEKTNVIKEKQNDTQN